jgi:metallophosphoesterase superfamily enzyme
MPVDRASALAPATPQIRVGGVRLQPLASRAAWLPDLGTLLVADVHLGKARSFTTWGVPVPEAVDALTLSRLTASIVAVGARRLVVLGDWLHGPRALDARLLQRLADWRREHAHLEVVVIDGNHDRRSRRLPASLGMIGVEGPFLLPEAPLLEFDHEPPATRGRSFAGPVFSVDTAGSDPAAAGSVYRLVGHLHPVVRVRGRADALRVPCFCFGPWVGVLPAFGEFTGGHPLRPSADDRIFVVAGDTVRELPGPSGAMLAAVG